MAQLDISWLQVGPLTTVLQVSWLRMDSAPAGPKLDVSWVRLDDTPVIPLPGAPTLVEGSPLTGSTASLSVTPGSPAGESYEAQVETPPGSGTWVTPSGAWLGAVFTATGLSPATAYNPRARAVNLGGSSAWTVGETFTTDNTGTGGAEIGGGALVASMSLDVAYGIGELSQGYLGCGFSVATSGQGQLDCAFSVATGAESQLNIGYEVLSAQIASVDFTMTIRQRIRITTVIGQPING